MQFSKTILLAVATATFALAGDVCPPTYCEVGNRCGYAPDGPHCCGGRDQKQVLQCVNGSWSVRNYCGNNQFCTCTGSKDLVCRNNSFRAAESSAATA